MSAPFMILTCLDHRRTYYSVLILFHSCLFCFFPFLVPLETYGQPLPPVIEPSGRSSEPPPVMKEEPLKPTPPPTQILPPLEELPGLEKGTIPPLRVFVKHIRVVGSTVFTSEALQKITARYENRLISTAELEELRQELTLLYVNNGYINSGAVIPDQTVEEGTVTIQIIEGRLSEIHVEGTKIFFPWYFEQRIRLAAQRPLNINPLRERLQLLLQDPRIQRLNSELKPGLRPGESILRVRVQEASPYKLWVEFNNFQSPTVGAERGLATLQHQNVFGFGDQFRFTFGRSEGVNPLIDTAYTVPITPWDTTLTAQFRRNDFEVVSDPFKSLNIESETEIVTVTIRHPIYRTLTDEVGLAATFERLRNQNFLGGTGFSFTPGTTNDGESIVSALRLIQEWIHREPAHVLALRSRFTVGLDVLDATNARITRTDPDGQFFAWLGQAQWARRFDPSGMQLLSSLALQLANDSLFPLEQFAVGGRYSVRGYRENQLVRDNAFVFSVEARLPILPTIIGRNVLFFAPFIDVGRSWNARIPVTTQETIASIGAGLRWSIRDRAQANVYWGHQLNHIPKPAGGNNLQDHGLHVQLVVNIL
ncbi:MAG: ShlB/FhaC/HecB family hemolysin secretion/activation protein [Nitrospirae bacterium]|nr:MAG: ShlB/FhaC/HecB family hemolysin secretion/activation protein [Nitrospirota bacterium]